jgi:chemotaxis protein MotB
VKGRRRRQLDHSENHERWLVSYADFITLLFAFFVVMYSISTARDGSYRVLSDAIVRALNTPLLALQRESSGGVEMPDAWSAGSPVADTSQAMIPLKPELLNQELSRAEPGDAAVESRGEINRLAGAVENRVSDFIDEELIKVERNDYWLEIEIKAQLLFASGSRVLLSDAVPVLENFATVLRDVPNLVNVEGFTDNVPIMNGRFPSNWELSAARAATVVRLFEENGIAPERMSATGYGEHRPIASNETPEGRARNRRVVLVVMSSAASGERLPGIMLAAGRNPAAG